ncbi:MAG: hypothetical protein CL676_01910 [Bdellovibrionaceae bacterium]|nr:hypothetical protein [Pseudobdellovibrionaceae bacterium]
MSLQKISSLILMSLFFGLSLIARAEEAPDTRPLPYKAWKEQQILNAQNRLLRISAELDTVKTTENSESSKSSEASSPKEQALERFQKTKTKSEVERLTKEQKLARQAVEGASGLTFEDYITVYLPTLSQSPEALETLVGTLSKEELTKILEEILKRQSDQRDRSASSSSQLNGFWAQREASSR